MKESTGRMILAMILILVGQGATFKSTAVFAGMMAIVAGVAALVAMYDEHFK